MRTGHGSSFRIALLLVACCAGATRAQAPGEVASELKISEISGGFTGNLHQDDRFGASVAVVGDLDHDGTDDLLVGAPRDDDGESQAGALWVLFLKPDGSVRETRKISNTKGGLGNVLDENDHFGTSVAALGDVNDDGVPDAAVGVPDADVDHPQAGAVRILFLKSDGSVKSSLEIGSGKNGFSEHLSSHDGFGIAVAGLGDLDGDGTPDLAVGAAGVDGDDDSDDDDQDVGAAFILFLEPDGRVHETRKLGAGEGGFSGSLDEHDGFGTALALAGDLDADGLPELAVGAPGDDKGASGAGAVWLLHLHADGVTQGQLRITSDDLPTPLHAGDHFGSAVAAPGDVDGDGQADLVVGTPDADQGGEDRGAVRLLMLTPDATVLSQVLISGLQGGFGGVLHNGDEFGIAIAASPTDAATGQARLHVGAWRDDDGGSNQGALWLLQLQGISASQPYVPLLESITGQAGQPAILLPSVGIGDDFIGEPVVVVPTTGNAVTVEQFVPEISGISFGNPGEFLTGNNPTSALTADFDGNGHGDILTANRGSDSVSLLKQVSTAADAGGGFAPKVDTLLPFDDEPLALGAGDLDGDGDMDAVVAGDAGLTTLTGNGLGLLVPSSFAPVAFLADLDLADLDGDGDLDVVSASGAAAAGPGAETGFATALSNDGTGDLTAFATFASGKAVATVLLGDFDLSGKPDALLAIHELDGGPGGVPQGRLALWLGNGSSFSPSPVFTGLALPNPDGIHPRWGALADVNEDGRLDAVYTSNDSLALPEGSLAQEQPPVDLTLLLSTPGGGLVGATVHTAYVGKGVTPLLLDIAPAPKDGFPDCILVWTQDTLAGELDAPAGALAPVTYLAALVGDGQGGFTDASPNQFLGAEEPGDALVADVGGSAGDGAVGGVDVLVPDLATRSLNVWLGDGAGSVTELVVTADVDPVDADALPAGGIWQGGPRSVAVLDLDGDPNLDVAIYSRWDDLAGLFASRAGFVTRHGDGTGHFAGGEDVLLPRAGELAVGDVGGDGLADIAVTLRTEGGGDSVALFAAGAGGQLTLPAVQVAPPPGYELTGGLELANVDGLPGDEVLASGQLAGAGAVIVVSQTGTGFLARAFPLDASWSDVRSLAVGTIDGDALPDVAVGVTDGRLVLGQGQGHGAFLPLVTGATAAAVGGGALRLTEIDGDGRADIVSSSVNVNGTLDQAFVRDLLGAGNGAFQVITLPGLSSVGVGGALRPATGDLDDDGATDLVITHGGSGNVSLLLNQLGTFTAFGEGKPGTGGLVPALQGKGYTKLGGTISLHVEGALGGAPALLLIGTGPLGEQPSWLAMQTVVGQLLVPLSGTPGAAGAGGWSVSTHLPNDDRYAGISLVLQLLVGDPGATTSGPHGIAASNGLSLTILP